MFSELRLIIASVHLLSAVQLQSLPSNMFNALLANRYTGLVRECSPCRMANANLSTVSQEP